jgi:hypothetical protein
MASPNPQSQNRDPASPLNLQWGVVMTKEELFTTKDATHIQVPAGVNENPYVFVDADGEKNPTAFDDGNTGKKAPLYPHVIGSQVKSAWYNKNEGQTVDIEYGANGGNAPADQTGVTINTVSQYATTKIEE